MPPDRQSLFGLGGALGCDYLTAHVIISESIPSAVRGRLVLSAIGFQALGTLMGTVVGYVVLKNVPEIGAWRWMYATAIIPAVLVLLARLLITESAHWLLLKGRIEEAEEQMLCLLNRTRFIGTSILGAIVTWAFRIDTTGVNLETVGGG